MFEFLSGMGSSLGGTSGWGSMAGGIINSLFGGRSAEKENPYLPYIAKSMEYASSLTRDAANPQSENFRNLASLKDEENRRALINGINQMMRTTARGKARGDVGFGVNPERRDESRTGALLRAFMQSKEQANQAASQQLMNMASGYRANAGQAMPMNDYFMKYGEMDANRKAGLYSGLGKMFDIIFSGGGTTKPQQTQPAPEQMWKINEDPYGVMG